VRNALLTLLLLGLVAGANPAGYFGGLMQARLRLDSGAAPVPWTPASITNCYYWFDLSDTNTIAYAGAGQIASVKSKGSVTNAMTASAGWPLATNDATTGLLCANFPTTSQLGWNLPTNIPVPATGGNPYTFVAAYDRAANGLYSILWSSIGPVYGQPALQATDNKLYAQMHGAYRGSSSTYAAGRSVVTVFGTGAETGYAIRWNGAAVTISGPTTLAAATEVSTVGYYQAGISHRGKMFELIYYNRQLSTNEIAQIESYLKTKWQTQ